MMNLTLFLLAAALLMFALLRGWREVDRRTDTRIAERLLAQAGPAHRIFDPDALADLPEPAQRYFRYSIQPGTPLRRAVELEMEGQLGLGTKDQPGYRPMRATQLLVPPYGLVWRVNTGSLSGSDGATPETSWTRFWMFGIVPVVRAGANEDHRRSAFGRVIGEGVFWAPASLLLNDETAWQSLGRDEVRATVRSAGLEQAVDITVAKDGQPTRVVLQRWSNANADGTFREQPFGGDLSEFENFDGYRLPTVVEGGNHIGTPDYFPFFKARVVGISYPQERDLP